MSEQGVTNQRLFPGAQLYYVPNGRLRTYMLGPVIVEKVGRKWATLSNGERIDLKTLYADGHGYSSPGRCYWSKDDHEQELKLSEAWRQFRMKVDKNYGPPVGVTINQIQNAMRALFKESA